MSGGNDHPRGPARPTPEQVVQALRRAWFPVARSVDLERPQGVTLLGEPLVAFRAASGRAAVTSRRCPHRGGDLALGAVVGDAIECAYHGWQYDAETGRCRHIPSGGRIPPGATVATHPVRERFGLVWTCIGAPLVDAPDLPELAPLELSYLAGQPVDTPAGILAALENFRDVAHFPFVHRASMGDVPHQVEKLDVTSDRFDTWLRRDYSASAGAADIYRDQDGIGFTYHSVVPSLASALVDYGPAGKRIVMEGFMPTGPTGCRIFLVSGVAADYTGATPEEALAAELGVLHEDKPILDSLIPPEVPLNRAEPEVSVAADRYTLATRRAFLSFVRQALAGPEGNGTAEARRAETPATA